MTARPSVQGLAAAPEDRRARLAEAEEVIRAIRDGDVDAMVVSGESGEQVYTLSGADRVYRSLVETMSEGALTLSADGVILYANQTFARLLQTPLERVIGAQFRSFVNPADQPVLADMFKAASREIGHGGISLRAVDGSSVPLRLGLSRLQLDSETLVCVVATDLTEEKKKEQELRRLHADLEQRIEERTADLAASRLAALNMMEDAVEAQQAAETTNRDLKQEIAEHKLAEQRLSTVEGQFRGLVEQSIAGIYIIQDGKMIYANPRCAKILGQGSVDELIGSDPLLWLTEADRRKFAENMRRVLDSEARSVAFDFAVLRRDGVTIDVGMNGARATHEGRPAIIGLLQDISEKKRDDEKIQCYIEQLKTAFMSTVKVAMSLSEMRDPYTSGHERRVGELAAAIGAELGFDALRIEGLRVAGYLHDIGKITIPAEMLSKPAKLSPIEFQLIQAHPRAGYEALKSIAFPWPVAEVALQHHERLDGSGYPQGLKGEAILLEARILAVADVIEAMASHRPYRPALGIEVALQEIERGRGIQYDPAVADACLKLSRESRYLLAA